MLAICWMVSGIWVFGYLGICEAAAPIPESEMISLQKALASPGDSAVAARRTMKNAVRKARALLQEAPQAPNRFAVLGIMFRAQKTLLAQDNAERNREDLFSTCEALAKAPDEYAELRLEADLLLSKLRHFRGKRRRWARDWRLDAATVIVKKPDDVSVELWATKAVILDTLGRTEDAASVRRRSEEPVEPGYPSIYWLFHQRLKNWRFNCKLRAE